MKKNDFRNERKAGRNSYGSGFFQKSKYLMIFFGLAFLFSYLSFLAFHTELLEADEVVHYSLNRSIPFNINFLINPWGKPLFTIVSFGLIVLTNDGGLIVIRLFNVLVSTATCFVTYKLCRTLGFSSFLSSLGILLISSSPLFTRISFSALTEPLFGLLVVLAFYFFYAGKFHLSAVVVSLSCLARQEGFLLLPLWWIFLRKHKKASFLTGVFPLLWSFMLLIANLSPFYMLTMYSNVVNPLVVQWEDTSMLGKGIYSLSYYAINSINILGPIILVLFTVGFFLDMKKRNHLLLNTGIVVYFFFHSLILVFPYFGSVGFIRHMYPLVPLTTISAISGLEKLRDLASRIECKRFNVRRFSNILLSIFLLTISLGNLLLTTSASYNRAVLIAASPSYNALQHEVGRFLVSHYPRNVIVFCPSSMFVMQLYLTLPNLYWQKENPSQENYTIFKLDGEFPLYSNNIYRDCPKGSLVIWNNDFIGSEFSPSKINRTRYAKRLDVADGLHRIIVYERT